jgi:hypothetical protein
MPTKRLTRNAVFNRILFYDFVPSVSLHFISGAKTLFERRTDLYIGRQHYKNSLNSSARDLTTYNANVGPVIKKFGYPLFTAYTCAWMYTATDACMASCSYARITLFQQLESRPSTSNYQRNETGSHGEWDIRN